MKTVTCPHCGRLIDFNDFRFEIPEDGFVTREYRCLCGCRFNMEFVENNFRSIRSAYGWEIIDVPKANRYNNRPLSERTYHIWSGDDEDNAIWNAPHWTARMIDEDVDSLKICDYDYVEDKDSDNYITIFRASNRKPKHRGWRH